MRLIDADRMKIDIEAETFDANSRQNAEVINAYINIQPTVDLDSIRKGSWEVSANRTDIGWLCSECGSSVEVPSPYCPACGVRMK